MLFKIKVCVCLGLVMCVIDGIETVDRDLNHVSSIVQSHSNSLAKIHETLRRFDQIWDWVMSNKKQIKDIIREKQRHKNDDVTGKSDIQDLIREIQTNFSMALNKSRREISDELSMRDALRETNLCNEELNQLKQDIKLMNETFTITVSNAAEHSRRIVSRLNATLVKGIREVSKSNSQTECEGSGYEYFEKIDWCAKISSDLLMWNQAPQACAASGGTFAIIDTKEKNEALSDMIQREIFPGTWIGLSANLEKGKFVWIDGTPISFSNWGEGQPDNASGQEDCVHFSEGWDYKWNDQSCETRFSYVCEKTRKKLTACPLGYLADQKIDWCIKLSGGLQTWEKVSEACKAEGGTFAVVDTKEKNDAVANLIRSSGIYGLWISLNDIQEEGKFVWIDGTPLSKNSFQNWGKGQPDNAYEIESCVLISSGWDYKWNDQPCDDQFRFLCEAKRT